MQATFTLVLHLILAAASTAQVFETTVNGDFAHPLGLRDEADYVGIADFNGDGFDDVLGVTDLYLADGLGAFVPSPITPSALARRSTAFGDLDGDGSLDLFAADAVLLNDGAGNFTELPGAVPSPPPASPCPPLFHYAHPVIADLDGDGDQDVFVSRSNPCTSLFAGSVFLNDGSGMLTELAMAGTPAVPLVVHSAADDVDADGDIDVIVISSGSADLYLNDGTGRLLPGPNLWTGLGATAGATGDIDGDGRPDHVFHLDITVVVLQRAISGFLPAVTSTTPSCTNGLVLIDLDLDGADEVCRVDPDGLTVSKVTSTGMLGPQLLRRPVRNRSGRSPLVGDLDHDGIDDVVAQFDVRTTTFLGNGQGGLEELPRHDLPAARVIDGAVADFDGDGDIDLLARRPAPGGTRIVLLENDGYGDFAIATASSIFVPNQVGEFAHVFDADGNGLMDVVVASTGTTPALVLLNVWGTFVVAATLPGSSSTAQLHDADLDGDGDRDLIVTLLQTSPSPLVFENLGGGSFAPPVLLPSPGGGARDVAVGDVDADGDPDICVGWDMSSAQILDNDGSGNFTVGQTPLGLPSALVTLGDYDGDGSLDATIGGALWLNDGTGTLAALAFPIVNFGNFGQAAWAGDIDHDGDDDYVTSHGAAHLNNGNLNFGFELLTAVHAFGNTTSRPISNDIDRDGDLDIFFDGYLWTNHAVQLSHRGHGRLGTSLKIDFRSRRPGGAAYWLLVSLDAIDLPAAPFGDLFVDPATLELYDTGFVASQSVRTTDVLIPNNPAIAGVDIRWQALFNDAGGIRLGSLHTTTLRP